MALSTQSRSVLLLAAFVDVVIDGRAHDAVVAVPRAAVRGGDTVWVAGPDDRLARHQVTVAWGTEDALYVTDGLSEGDRVVTSALSLPVDGMAVRTADEPATPAGG